MSPVDVGDKGLSDCEFVSSTANNIGVGSGALQVSPNLEGLGNCDGHSYLGDCRHNPVVCF